MKEQVPTHLLKLPVFKQRAIVREFGEGAKGWIEHFPRLVTECAERWQLTLLGCASAGLPINVTFFAERHGEQVVLKTGYPHPEQLTEMKALSLYGGRPAVKLIDCSESLGATLMERIVPGTTFRESGNTIERSRRPIDIFARLPQAIDPDCDLPRFEDWLTTAFSEFSTRFGRDHDFHHHITGAAKIFDRICTRDSSRVLLHGDLHHENLLLDEQGNCIAIDPKGVIGPRTIECGRFVHNFLEDEIPGAKTVSEASPEQLREVLDVRVNTLSRSLGMSHQEIAEVAYVDCVLSFCWSINSNHPWRGDAARLHATLQMLG